jgi:hypothetical protein
MDRMAVYTRKSNFNPLAHIFNDTLSQLVENDVEKHSQELSNMVSLVTIDTNLRGNIINELDYLQAPSTQS